MNRHVTACDCAGTCSIAVITEFEPWGDEPQEYMVDFSQTAHYSGWRARLQAAIRVFLGKDPWAHSITLYPESVMKLENFLRDARLNAQQKEGERIKEVMTVPPVTTLPIPSDSCGP